MEMKQPAAAAEEYMIDRRRYYHRHPELSGQETATVAAIRRDLEEIGITEITELQRHHGLVAVIRGAKPGKRLGLRADMDALPINEATGLPYASQNKGVMHACGHDAHIAMLLGTAKLLVEAREQLCGSVKLIFQPSEENASGALWMTEEHLTDDIDALYGAHVWGELDAPLIDVSVGNRMAAADLFDIDVYGTSAHGAAPHLGVDAIAVACNIFTGLQQCASRMNDPLNPFVLTIGEFTGGPRFNVISNHVHMRGTTRYFSADLHIEEKMRRVIERTAEAFGARAELVYQYKSPAVINRDEQLCRIAREAVVKLYGEESIGHTATTMGGEDFPQLALPGVPTFFAFIGSRNAEKGLTYTNHHEKYTVEESVLQRGTAVMAQFAVDYLAETAE